MDGDDPAHARKRGAYQHDTTESHSEAVVSTRFLNRGEIYYCIASILKYAKFINRIWIMTDNQRPAWIDSFAKAGLVEPDFIQIVDHSTVFRGYEKFLPTFNSLSIEAVTWRIPDLAEHFVYLNDDFFLNRPVEPSTFFVDGQPRLRGWFADPSHRRPKIRLRRFLRKVTGRPPNNRPSFRIAQELGAQLAGVNGQFLHVGHHPHPLRRSVIEAYYADHPHVLEKQVGHRFRSVKQYLPVALSNHLELARHTVTVEPEVEVAYVKPSRSSLSDPAFADIRDGVSLYGCIQSLDECSEESLRAIGLMTEQKIGAYLPKPIRAVLQPSEEA